MLSVSLPAAMLGGLISFLSPCVLPLVPPYLSFLAGTTFDRLSAGDDHAVRRRAVLAALLFVAGFSTVFVLLGAAWLWTFAFTDYHPEQRPYGLAASAAALTLASGSRHGS